MTDNGLFSVGEFAHFTRTTRDTLHHYDRIGLVSPTSRGKNNYRYYSGDQLAVVNVIRTLQQLGMSLSEIKKLRDQRSPAHVDELLEQQIEKIDQKIEGWIRAKKLLFTVRKSIRSVSGVDENTVTIQFLPEEAIVLGDINDYSQSDNAYDALLVFYHAIQDRYPDLDLNYPVWGIFTEKQIKQGDWTTPNRYYFYNPEGPDRRPAAFYTIGYTHSGYGQGGRLYERLVDYIDRNGFEICGDTYEEYPLNELCIPDGTDYLMRVLITVRKKI